MSDSTKQPSSSAWPVGKPNSLTTSEQVRELGLRLKGRSEVRNDRPSNSYWCALAEEAIRYVHETLKWSPQEKTPKQWWLDDARPVINAIGEISVQEAMDAVERML